MKQEILCPPCAVDLRNHFPTDNPYPGEYLKFLPGLALSDFLCDYCGIAILTDQDCTAYSVWTDRRPYIPWEQIYIKIEEDP